MATCKRRRTVPKEPGPAAATSRADPEIWLFGRHAVFAALGNRGYRAAQLEGGIRGGQIYLAAYAQRFGASGLTFFDDEVIEFFSPHASGKSVLFLTAIGRSVRARRQGAR